MWRKQFIGATAFFSGLLAVSASAQAVTNQAPITATIAVAGQTNILMRNPRIGPKSFFATNLNAGLSAPAVDGTSAGLPLPGVYKTQPYSCIVVVPAKQPDDRSLVKPAESGSAMPVVKPELRFIPLPPK
jgi:hypothetical protein